MSATKWNEIRSEMLALAVRPAWTTRRTATRFVPRSSVPPGVETEVGFRIFGYLRPGETADLL